MRFVHWLLEPATAATLGEAALIILGAAIIVRAGIAIHYRARDLAGARKEHPT